MPHWDIRCEQCGTTRDMSFPNHAAMKLAVAEGCGWCDGPLEIVPSTSVIEVRGFNALNHYGAKHTDSEWRTKDGVKVTVKEHTEVPKGQGQR